MTVFPPAARRPRPAGRTGRRAAAYRHDADLIVPVHNGEPHTVMDALEAGAHPDHRDRLRHDARRAGLLH